MEYCIPGIKQQQSFGISPSNRISRNVQGPRSGGFTPSGSTIFFVFLIDCDIVRVVHVINLYNFGKAFPVIELLIVEQTSIPVRSFLCNLLLIIYTGCITKTNIVCSTSSDGKSNIHNIQTGNEAFWGSFSTLGDRCATEPPREPGLVGPPW